MQRCCQFISRQKSIVHSPVRRWLAGIGNSSQLQTDMEMPTVQPPLQLLEPAKIPTKRLHGPGPANLRDEVKNASKVMDDVREGLKYVLQTNNKLTFVVSGTGHAGMECALLNLLERGEKVLIVRNGIWGERASSLSKRLGFDVEVLNVPDGEAASLDAFKSTLEKVRPAAAFICQGESSTGVLHPLEGFGAACHDFGTLLIVDTVASLGATPFDCDQLQVDCVYSASQKVLNAPPGMAPISFSDLAVYHHTGPVSLIYSLREALAAIVREGLDESIQRHEQNAKVLHSLLEQNGFELFVKNPPDYVVVTDSANGEPIELPTGEDKIDSTGTKFHPPKGGWSDKVFNVIYQTEPTSKRSISGDPSAKRKKRMDESIASDSDGEGNGTHSQVTAKLQRLNEEDDSATAAKSSMTAKSAASKNDKSEHASSADITQESQAKTEQSLCSDIIVLGLPYRFNETQMREYFSEFGPVEMCEIKKPRDGDGKLNKGFGFVRMERLDDQDAILKASSHVIGGRKCQVKLPMSKDNRDGRQENVRLFVGRLNEKISTKRLRDFFDSEARKIDSRVQIVDVFIPSPFRGFAFVTLSSTSVAKELLKKDNFVIDDVTITLSIAAPKQQQAYNSPPSAYFGRAGNYYDPNPVNASPLPSGSNALANNLETLNLNHMQPEVLNSAWQAFWSVAQSNPQAGPSPMVHRAYTHQQRPSLYPPTSGHRQRANHPSNSPGQWH
ncbi:RNA binding protein [Aphelenchoides besseyi]|nr:RNA binding protein [Aphelenchoides besseyi]